MSAAPPFTSLLSPDSAFPLGQGFTTEPPGTVCVPCQAARDAKKAQALRKPCDVSKLEVSDAKTGVTLKTAVRLVALPLAKDVPPHLKDDLKQYDLVLERVADYIGRRIEGTGRNQAEPAEKLVFKAVTAYVGSCDSKSHPLLEMVPIGSVECEPKMSKSWKATQTDKFELAGRKTEPDHTVGGFLSPFWVFDRRPQAWEVTAPSCGIRAAGSAVVSLTALVRVYSHDEYELSFSFPSALGFSAERAGSLNVKGQHSWQNSNSLKSFGQTLQSGDQSRSVNRDGSQSASGSSSSRQNGNLVSTGHELEVDKNGQTSAYARATSSQSSSGGALMLVQNKSSTKSTTSLADGVKDESDFEQEVEIRPALSLKKNGQEMDVTKFLNNLFNLASKIKKAVEDIQKLVPSVGWKVSFELKLLEGSITGKWGLQNGDSLDPKDGKPAYTYTTARYAAVRKYYGLEFNVVVFGATLTLMVGVEVKVDAVFWTVAELVIKLEGKLAGEVSLKWAVTSDLPTKAPFLEATLKGTVSGVCKANAVGYHLVDAAAELTGGLKFTGTPVVSLKEAPRIDGELGLMKTEVMYFGSVGKERPQPVKVPIYDERALWSGNLLGASAAKAP